MPRIDGSYTASFRGIVWNRSSHSMYTSTSHITDLQKDEFLEYINPHFADTNSSVVNLGILRRDAGACVWHARFASNLTPASSEEWTDIDRTGFTATFLWSREPSVGTGRYERTAAF